MPETYTDSLQTRYEAIGHGGWDAFFADVHPDFELVTPDRGPLGATTVPGRKPHARPSGTSSRRTTRSRSSRNSSSSTATGRWSTSYALPAQRQQRGRRDPGRPPVDHAGWDPLTASDLSRAREGIEGGRRVTEEVALREVRPEDADACARILFDAFGGIHDHHRFPRDFPSMEAATGMMAAWIPHPAGLGSRGGERRPDRRLELPRRARPDPGRRADHGRPERAERRRRPQADGGRDRARRRTRRASGSCRTASTCARCRSTRRWGSTSRRPAS